MSTNKRESQRALVLQGGGALGAYDAGVFKALYHTFDTGDSSNSKPLFNIVAGTTPTWYA
jgi:NTE family protein